MTLLALKKNTNAEILWEPSLIYKLFFDASEGDVQSWVIGKFLGSTLFSRVIVDVVLIEFKYLFFFLSLSGYERPWEALQGAIRELAIFPIIFFWEMLHFALIF